MRSVKSLKKIANTLIILAVMMMGAIGAKAQLTGFHSTFFQNQYLANPAMAGLTEGLIVNLGYQQQWNGLAGAPKLQNATADYGIGNGVGVGLNVNNDAAGLLSRTRVLATYAYHIALSGDEEPNKLSFGLSFGINSSHLDNSKIIGDAGDESALDYNSNSVYLDGDVGAAYTSNKFTLQAALPNLRSAFFKTTDQSLDVDRSTFFTAVSYKFNFASPDAQYSFEPKVAFRGVKGFDNIVDAGGNLDLATYNFSLSAMYHSSKSLTMGLGLDLKSMVVLLAYTTNTGQLKTYADNTFELGLKIRLFNK